MNISKTVFISIVISFFLSGCDPESGTPFSAPNKSTQPPISFGTHFPVDNTGGTIVPNYATLGSDSADLTVNFGSKTFTFGDRDMTLSGFGTFAGSNEIHRFSVQEDSRGIKAVRQALYHVRNNDYDNADFHYLAKDNFGNIILTETTALAKTDESQRPFMQPFPSIVFRNNLNVGESWVSGATYIPWFYDFNRGWKVTLVDDNATAPASGEPGCIVLFYQRTQQAYYVYLKDEIGIVDVVWEWERDASGDILPLGGYTYKPATTVSTGVPFSGFGFENNTSTDSTNDDIVDMPIGRSVFVQLDGDAGYTYTSTGTVVPANSTGFDSFWIGDDDACSTTTTMQIELCDLQFLENLSVTNTRVSFSDTDFSGIVGFYQPRIRVMVDDNNDGSGAIYRADNTTTGDLVIEPYYGLSEAWGLRTVMISGTVVNEANAADQRELFMLVDLYSARAQAIDRESYIVFEADADNKLAPGTVGQTRRISWNNVLFPGAEPTLANTRVNWGTTPTTLTNVETNILCVQSAPSVCASPYRVAEFTLPSSAGTYYYQIETDHSGNTVQSPVYEMTVSETSSTQQLPVPRIFSSFSEGIKGSLDGSGNFTVVVSGTQSRDPDGSIYSYGWDFGDGSTALTDSAPLVSHTYTQNGTFDLTLTVTDADGGVATITEPVLITNIATIDITYLVFTNYSPKHEILICVPAENICEISNITYFNWQETKSFEVQPGAGKQYRIVIYRTEEDGSQTIVNDELIFLNAGDSHPVTLN